MIRVSEISKEFGKGKNEKKVLDKVSFEVPNGQIVGLFGRKGTGKSVLIRIITGIQSSSHGRVLLNRDDIAEDPEAARLSFGYVPDSTDLFQGLTGEEYLNFIADVYEVEKEDREAFVKEYAKELKVEHDLKEIMSECDKNKYKKMMLMGAMIHEPDNLILDKFFDDLDSKDVDLVKKILRKYADTGHAVLLAEQRLKLADGLCDRVVYLKGGKVDFNGSVPDLMEKYERISSIELVDLMINEETSKVIEKETSQPILKLWGGK